jgi:RNA polymerase sigma-70 factor, ECF subfamily
MRGMHEWSDDDLLLGAAAGDRQAFAEFYRRYEGPVLAFCARRLGDPELAADLTGEVFAAALQALGRYRRGDGSAAGWVFSIASHKLADSLRRGRVQDRARRRLGMAAVEPADEALERIERLASDDGVRDLLDALPESQRAAILARVVDDRGYREIALTLRCSESVVRKRVSRGLAALREQIEEERHADSA